MFEFINYILIFFSTYLGEAFAAFFGGGSFLIQPALIAIGIDAKVSIANDVASTAFAAAGFLSHKNIRNDLIRDYQHFLPIILVMFPAILVGSYAGSNFLKMIPSQYVLWGVLTIASIGLIKMLYEHFNQQKPSIENDQSDALSTPVKYWAIFMILSSIVLAFYDGISGAGGGTLQILAFAMIFRMKMKNILILSAIFSGISLCSAGINFYFLDLLDAKLMAIMVPAAFAAGYTASYFIQFIKEEHLRLAFIAILAALLSYLIGNQAI